MANRYNKVVGFFAYASPSKVVCSGGACVISGSERAMRAYVKDVDPTGRKHTIKKTRFGEILQGLGLGAAYAFDEDSYKVFYPLAKQEGLNVAEGDFKAKKAEGFRFFTVELKSP
ncbi:MAG: hypothetical protein ACE5IY_19850 [bacterium]